MSEKTARQIRKEMNRIAREHAKSRSEIINGYIKELSDAPFKERFSFAVKILFQKKKSR